MLGHALVELLDALVPAHPPLARLREVAQQLDQYYVPTRYPNGLPGGVPADVFTKRQAEEAIAGARDIIAVARGALQAASPDTP